MADQQQPQKQPQQPPRPQLSPAMHSSSSYLTDHQQYRSPPATRQPSLPPHQPHHYPEAHFAIDDVVTGSVSPPSQPPSSSSPFAFNGIPSVDNPPTIIESGLEHGFSHPNCAPAPGDRVAGRLVATLFYKDYKDGGNGHGNHHTSSSSSPSNPPHPPSSSSSPSTIPENLAPTTSLDKFPLEPPSSTEPEHLDHLYGSHVSQFCLTSFLHLMSTLPLGHHDSTAEPTSSHRCLDAHPHPRVVELLFRPAPSPSSHLSLADLRRHELIYRFEREWGVDVVLQPDTLWRHHPRLVVFDMDSTLILQEVIELLAETVSEKPDLAARVADITARAMAGELEFESAFRERVALLKGVPASRLTDLRALITVTPGVRALLRALRRLGVKTAVCSGGFQPLTTWLAHELGIDHAHANVVDIDDAGLLTGTVSGTIVGAARKAQLLREIARHEGVVDLAQTVAVGDGANDLEMMAVAGLGVAWHAKPRVQMEADARLNGESMTDLLYLFGFTAQEIELLCAEE